MDANGRSCSSGTQSEEEIDLRRGPWTVEEDLILLNYVANHGEGRWNSLARCSGRVEAWDWFESQEFLARSKVHEQNK
uniref:Uncharacterized protein n=1 Tax=Nelumbo nucifera TaxID=4432 RepID=A0A822XRL1_NELNU|nr:TPA_asm: hypothetical protein HUJ06_024420 [Nelumbo nucifera]